MVWFAFLAVARMSRLESVLGDERARVLIAEDHGEFAVVLSHLLSVHFTVLEIVTSGERLIERCTKLQPDVVVSDIGLEGLDGIKATTRIRETFPNLPVVLITVGDVDGLRAAAEKAGASALLLKTELTATLVPLLKELVKMHL